MLALTAQLLVSGAVVVVAGVLLARAADSIAMLTGMGRLLAGSLFLAGATSLPELSVDVSAIRARMPDLAVGDLMGSSLMNLLILAVADLLHRQPHKMLSRAAPGHALSAALGISLTALAALTILVGPYALEPQLGEIGLGPVAIGVAYVLGLRLVYYAQQTSAARPGTGPAASPRGALGRALSVYGLCALAILVAAPFLADAAGRLADASGLGETFVGSTLLAFSTSLPEAVSTAAAVRMGAFDLAVGNVFGSNAFNMVLFVPLDLVHEGNLLASVSPAHAVTAMSVILATSVAVMGQLHHVEKRRLLLEPDALAVMGVVLGALLLLYWTGVR